MNQPSVFNKKKFILIFLSIILLASLFLYNNVMAGKSQISLNSPASFPIDI
jgi:hypothetical protein